LFLLISFCFLLLHPQTKAPNKKASECKQPKTKSSNSPTAFIRTTHPNQKNNKTKLPFLDPLEPSQKLHPREAQTSFVHEKKTPKTPKRRRLGEGGKFYNKSKNQSKQNASKPNFINNNNTFPQAKWFKSIRISS
jgi:hypothetical protein